MASGQAVEKKIRRPSDPKIRIRRRHGGNGAAASWQRSTGVAFGNDDPIATSLEKPGRSRPAPSTEVGDQFAVPRHASDSRPWRLLPETRTDGKAYDRILISEAIARGVAGQVIILDGEKSES